MLLFFGPLEATYGRVSGLVNLFADRFVDPMPYILLDEFSNWNGHSQYLVFGGAKFDHRFGASESILLRVSQLN